MKVRNKSPSYLPIILIVGFSVVLVGIAQTATVLMLKKEIVSTITESSSVVKVQPAEFSPQLYWLEIIDNRILLIPKTTNTAATSPEIALKDTLTQLFTQSPNSELTTTIPQQTHLLGLQISENKIYINLSQDFSQGGGSSSMIYRVAQVLYTATSINPQAQVFLSIEGKPLNEKYPLGGEGLILEYPLTRQNFAQDFLIE